MKGFTAMHLEKRSSRYYIAERKWGTEIPKAAGFVSSAENIKMVRIRQGLLRDVPVSAEVDAANLDRAAANRSKKNIADWSSYLPANCVTAMIALGWDRTT